MSYRSLLLASCFFAAAHAHAAIDFTPRPGERVLEGIKFPQLHFNHAGKTITYEQPRGWTHSGGGASIKFTPPALAQATAEIEQTPLPAPQPFTDESVKILSAQARAAVPPDSQNVVVISEERNPFRIGGNETYAVTLSYTAFGQEFERWVLFMNLPDTQVRFRITARKADFENVQKAFRGSLFSWQWK